METNSEFPNLGDNIEILKKIREGGFGAIYLAQDSSLNLEVAIKVDKNPLFDRLSHEICFYKHLRKDPSYSEHFPKYHYAVEEKLEDFMVIEYMGMNLHQLLKLCGGKFTLKTVLMIADQMLECIQFLHSKGVLHRDIKPDNFVIGREEKSNRIYLIDFGSADFYLDSNGEHFDWGEMPMIATLYFASVHNHLWRRPVRRDDLESIGFCLCYFLKGKLPWHDVPKGNLCELEYGIRYIKFNSIESVYENLPEEFEIYCKYCRKLGFFEDPDYEFLRGIFKKLFIKQGFEFDDKYDWEPILKIKNK